MPNRTDKVCCGFNMDRVDVNCKKISSGVRINMKKLCSVCDHRFNKLSMHLNVAHSGGKHGCKICPCSFHHYSGLEHHIRFKHVGKRDKDLPKGSLKRMKMNMSDQSKVSASRICKKTAISRLNSKAKPSSSAAKSKPEIVPESDSRKAKNSSPREVIRVICEDCGNTVLQSNLLHHLKSLHRGGRFACNLCPCSGFTVAALTNHKRRHHENKRQPIPTYLTQLKLQGNSVDKGLKIALAGASSSVEISDDQVQQVPAGREGSCSPEIMATFCYEGSSLDADRIVSIEPDASEETPKKSQNVKIRTSSRNLRAVAAPPTNPPAVMTESALVQQRVHQQELSARPATKKLEPATNIPMRVAGPNKTLLPLQAATGKNSVDFRPKHKGNVSYFVGHDSEIICVGDSHGEPISTSDFNGNLPEKSSSAIRRSTGMQIPLQPLFPTCHVCQKMFVSPAALGNHMKTHVAVCGYCGKTVPTLEIVAHMPNCAKVVTRSSCSSSSQ